MTRTLSNEGQPLGKYAQRHYAILFYSLLATLAAGPLLDAFGLDTRLLEILLGVNLLAAVIPLRSMSQRGLLLAALVVTTLIRIGAEYSGSTQAVTASLAMWSAIALVAAAGAIRFAMRAKSVDREHLYAALDAYVLFGLFLGVLYWAIDRALPQSLAVIHLPSDHSLTLSEAVYFSFVTLVTLGYGDIVPRGEAARGIAIVEAVAGQLYLAVMIAYLVSLHVLAARDAE